MLTVDFKYLAIRPGDRILDVGCGSGRHMAEAYRFPRVTVSGMDRSLEDLVQARERLEFHGRLGEHGGGCWGLAQADIVALPYADDGFDAVICSEVLEHIADDTRAIREVLRVLRPGGVLAVSVPRLWPETVCWRLSRDYRTEKGGHLRIYHRRRLVQRIQSAGARCFAHHFAHGLHAPFWWLKCLVGFKKNDHLLVRLYHRFLVWDLMARPVVTRGLENLLNPLTGKSDVVYFRKLQCLPG